MMKFNNIKRAALLLLAGVSIACSEGPDEMTDGSIPQEYAPIFSAEIINQPADESRAYVDEEDYYVKWEAGDRISAFIKESTQQSPYILETGAGEVTATFKAANTTVYQGEGTQNCAAYPECAGATFDPNLLTISYPMPATQTYKQRRYAGLEPHLVAHLIDGEQFEFRTFTGYLALKLYTEEATDVLIKSIKLETPSGEPISGTMTISVARELSGLKKGGQITKGSTGSTNAVTLDCGDGVVLSKNQSAPTLFAFALPVNARESDGTGGYVGMKFTVTDTQGRTMVLETKNHVGVARGRISTMATRTFEPTPVVEAIDLSINLKNGIQQPSNCYVIPGPGRYKFPTRHVNGGTIERYKEGDEYFENLIYTATASYDEWGWMWRTDASIELSDMSYDPATRYFSFTIKEENYKPGSISIVARDINGHGVGFIHNWHLWLVNDLQEIEVQGKNGTNYTLLDRNIGATTKEVTSPDSHGFLYQWGCKDPKYNRNYESVNGEPEINTYWAKFGKYSYLLQNWQFDANKSGWEDRNNYPVTISSSCTMKKSLWEGTKIIRGDFNWILYYSVSYSSTMNDYPWANILWSSPKTDFDPCPVGYRVPTYAEINDLKTNSTGEAWLLTDGVSEAALPTQNYVDAENITSTGNLVWTSTYLKDYGDLVYNDVRYYNIPLYGAFIYRPNNIDSYAWFFRANAIPVRCIKENR